MATATQLMTADELFRLPHDGMRHELIRGELTTMPPAGFEHGVVSVTIASSLHNYVRDHDLGVVVGAETGFVLEHDPDTVRAPDTAFISKAKLARVGMTRKYFPEAPDAAVEVLSPSDTVDEVDDKVQQWLAAGTQLVWVANPRQKTVTVYRLDAKPIILTTTDVLEGGETIPGFRLPVRDIFLPV